jgi:hypothetical protein
MPKVTIELDMDDETGEVSTDTIIEGEVPETREDKIREMVGSLVRILSGFEDE